MSMHCHQRALGAQGRPSGVAITRLRGRAAHWPQNRPMLFARRIVLPSSSTNRSKQKTAC